MPEITLTRVDKSYDGKTKAVTHLDLEVKDGDFMCLLGPSGCGKTTTLRMIAGLENVSAGEIAVGERLLDSRSQGIFVSPENRGMGLVFQSYALWPHLTVEKNTDFGLRLRGVPTQQRKERVAHVMSALGIAEYRDRYPSQLSGGQQQRVALARMLVIEPDVLLLDEPLSNLDARLRLEMRTELKRIHEEFGTTIVFVTHDQWEAMTLATRIAVMNKGSIQQVGSPDEIYEQPANTFVAEFVGNPPINQISLADSPRGNRESQKLLSSARTFVENRYSMDLNVASIAIRPEALRLTEPTQPPDTNNFSDTAILSAVLPTGGSWIIELNIEGVALFMTTHTPPLFRVGETVRFHVDKKLIHLFDSTGKRLSVGNNPTQRAK